MLESINNGALDKRLLEMEVRKHFEDASRKLDTQMVECRKLFLGAIETLINTLESSDRYTRGHAEEVVELAMEIGKQFDSSTQQMDDLHWAVLLHDLGKITVDPDILNKPNELTPNEYRHVMTYAVIGPNLVKPFMNSDVVQIISNHDDYYNGDGRRQVVIGTKIPLGA